MRLEKGVQSFTTGVPHRDYSSTFDYHHPTNNFSRRQTFTSSQSKPAVIAYLVFEDKTFFNRFAFKNNDGTYRTKDSKSLTREEINTIHKENIAMRSIVTLLSQKERYYNDLIAHSVEELGLDEITARGNVGYLIVQGIIGYLPLGKLSANKRSIDLTVFTIMLDPFAKMRTKRKAGKEKTMPCSF